MSGSKAKTIDLNSILGARLVNIASQSAQMQKAMAPILASSAAQATQMQKAMAPILATHAAQAAQMRKAMAPILASTAAQAVQMQKAMAPILASHAAQAAQMQKAIAPFLANLARAQRVYSDQWRRIGQALAEWDAAERALMAALAPRGWLIAPDLPMSITTRLLRIKDRDGLRAVESALMEIFSPAYCGKLLRATYSRPSFQMWRPTLEKAMRAHRRRDFALAIPIWLMAIDGVAQDELSRPAVFNNLGTRSRQEMAKSLETGGLRDILLDAWLDVMVGIGGNRSGSSSGLVLVVNRHEVLHGRRPRVGGERDSIQCILVLHLLHYFLSQRELQSAA